MISTTWVAPSNAASKSGVAKRASITVFGSKPEGTTWTTGAPDAVAASASTTAALGRVLDGHLLGDILCLCGRAGDGDGDRLTGEANDVDGEQRLRGRHEVRPVAVPAGSTPYLREVRTR